MIEADRLVAAAPVNPQEEVLDRTLRPRALDDLFLHAGDLGADHAIELVVFDHRTILCLGEHF